MIESKIELKYALIFEKEVKNVFICDKYDMANALARASFGNNAYAVETTRYATGIGDKYENGIFYHVLEDGSLEKAVCIPTEKDNITELKLKMIQCQLVLTEAYESKISLETKISTLQQTITKLYEKNGGK